MRRSSPRRMADSFRLAALEAALRAGDCHAFACPHAEEVDFDFGEGGEDVEEHLAHRVGGVVDLSAEREFDPPGGEVVADRPGVGHRSGEPVELGTKGVSPSRTAVGGGVRRRVQSRPGHPLTPLAVVTTTQ